MAPLSQNELEELKITLRRCSLETVEAAIRYREQGDLNAISTTIFGIIERFQPSTSVIRVADANDQTRLIEDLGLDSLALLEVALCTEEVLKTRIDNEELRGIRTVGQLNDCLRRKLSGE